MKAPGILHRVSFLVVVNSLFIFVTVLLVSIDNNQAKIDRLIGYRFDFISHYFRAELDLQREIQATAGLAANDRQSLDKIFERAQRHMQGLGSLALMAPAEGTAGYTIAAASYRETLDKYDPQIWEAVIQGLDPSNLRAKGIHVGRRFEAKSGPLKTVYIPVDPAAPKEVLAITFVPEEIIGGDLDYNWTIILLFFTITLITLLIINLLFRKFVRPLQHLVQGMEKTARGEVLYKIEDMTNNEMGRVAAAFNAMSSALWDKRQQLTLSNRNLTLLNRRLTETLHELSNANALLAESNAFLAKLIENSPVAVIATDARRRILIFSQAATSIFGIRVDQALGRDLSDFFPYSREKVFTQDADSDRMLQEEMICSRPTGESFPALVTRVAIRESPSQVSAFLFIIRDITESRGFKEMMISIDRMATRGVMAGEIAHEINNYLAIILGNVELLPLLLARGDMEKVEKKFEVLRATVGKIQRFSEGLMGYGDEAAVFEPGDLNQVIENLVAFLKPQNRYDGIGFHLALSPQLPLIEFDSSQLQQLFVNLLNNAADALREKSADRRIDITTCVKHDSPQAEVIIADSAGGLPDDLHQVIFQDRYTGKRRGRGFGLVIVKRIIDKHGGSISYDSHLGEGTRFTITLPIKAARPDNDVILEQPRQVTS